ncbi:MAG: hypothetical protein ACK4TK_00360 [Thiobacillaceae bacterium]
MDWNVIVTVRAGPGHGKALLDGLKRLGEFHATDFKYVCYGRVEDASALLEAVSAARQAARRGRSIWHGCCRWSGFLPSTPRISSNA